MDKPTIAELRQIVTERFPYVPGEGNLCLQKRTNELKKLMRKHDYPVEVPRTAGPTHVNTKRYSNQQPYSDQRR